MNEKQKIGLKRYAVAAIQREQALARVKEFEEALVQIERDNCIRPHELQANPVSVLMSDGKILTFSGETTPLNRGTHLLKYRISESL